METPEVIFHSFTKDALGQVGGSETKETSAP